jgi:aminoglycoside 3-N-acetyltransferase
MNGGREHAALTPVLRESGVSNDSVLVVHSAIARLSRKGYRAEAIIETLLDYIRIGTLIMPTMTWRTVTVDHPVWDELETASLTGILSEIFRTRYATARSIHPTHSAAGHGRQAAHLLSRHHLDETPVSANSPYGLMRDSDAHVLMIGVGLETCTAIHLPEETFAPDVYLRPTVETYDCTDRHGVTHTVRTRRHWRLDRDFPQFAPPLAEKGQLQAGEIDGCPYMIVSLRHLLDEITSSFARDKSATLRRQVATV